MISSKAPGGAWGSGSTWVGGQAPSPNDSVNIVAGSKVTIAQGTTVVIQGAVVIAKGGSLTNSGSVTVGGNGGSISNYGTLTNNASGTITNNSDVTNYGTLGNSGTIVNNAGLANNGVATLNNSGTLQLNGLGIVYATEFPSGVPPMPMFTGLLFSQGILVQQPGSAIVLGAGTQLYITPFAGNSSFAIPSGASLVISYGASLIVQAEVVVNNAGTISNSGVIEIVDAGNGLTPGALNNSGTLTNNAGHILFKSLKGMPYETQGSITNEGTITNTGTLNNGWSGKSVEPVMIQPSIDNSGTIGNSGTVTNYGTIDNGGVINNNGVFHKDGGVLKGSAVKGTPPVP